MVAPAVMVTDAGDTVTFDVSPLERLTVTPPAGAGAPSVTDRLVDWPRPTLVLAGIVIVPGVATVTVAVALGMPVALAVIVADPGATPTTGTVVVVAPAAKFADAPTVAAAVLFELRLTVKPPAGAGPDNVRVRFCVAVPMILRVPGVKLRVAVTCTVPVPEV